MNNPPRPSFSPLATGRAPWQKPAQSGRQPSHTARNYRESLTVLRDLFPKDRPIVLVCGGGGYAGFTKKLLTYLGWDPELLYNAGGMWDYAGEWTVGLIDYGRSPDDDLYAIWRADYAVIDFTLMRPESVRYNRSTQ